MTNHPSDSLPNNPDKALLQDPTNPSFKKPKKELPFAFYGKLSDKEQGQFISRTADLLMQDALFSELSPKPLPSRDQIMSQLREYVTDSLKVK